MNQATADALRPWTAQYGTTVPAHLPPPAHASLASLARAVAQRFGGQTAFTTVMPNGMYGSLSYAEVDEMSDAFAVYLRAVLKLEVGDRVAVQLPNGLAYPVVLLGILKAGCVAVNTNPLYTPHEMAHQFKDSGVKVVVIVDMFADKLEQVLPLCPAIQHVVLTRVSEFFPALVGGIVHAVMKHWNKLIPAHTLTVTHLPEALDLGRAQQVDVPSYASGLNHASLALLQYTGGTTGRAKGAMLSHGNLLWNMAQMRAMCASHLEDGREVVLTALPLYHIFAFTVNFLCMFEAGARNILVPNPRPVQNLQRAFENYPITWMTGVNTLYNALLNEEWFTAYPPKHLKAAGGGGASMHHAVVKRFEAVTGAPLVEGYGLTEASPVVCFQLLSTARQRDSIGVPVPMTDLRLLDDEGAEVATGAPGELWLRGPQVMQGYWQQPAETAAVLREGWLRTGDVAVMDAQGTFKIVDRKKDMILVNGFNVYPNEIEEALSAHPQILEAAVIGVADAKTGEAVLAFVVRLDASLSEQAVLDHCRSLLTAYKLPVRVEFRHELPKTAVGKILRRELRPVAAPTPTTPSLAKAGS